MLIKVYRVYSEGSGELLIGFIRDLLSFFFFQKQLWVIENSWGDGLQMHHTFVCVGIYEELWIASWCL